MEFKNKRMLDYCKEVLTKLSFDTRLFSNELKKSLSWLDKTDQAELQSWYKAKYAYIKIE